MPLAAVVVAQPEVVREQVEPLLDRLGFGRLQPPPDPAVEHRPQGERQALVRHLLGGHVLEQVGLLGDPVEVDEVGRPQGVQVDDDLVEGAELRVRPGQDRRLEQPAHDARDLERPAGRFGHLVDPRQDEAVQALRELERPQRPGVGQVDPPARDEADELLDVERVAAGAVGHEADELVARVAAPARGRTIGRAATWVSFDSMSAAASSLDSTSRDISVKPGIRSIPRPPPASGAGR